MVIDGADVLPLPGGPAWRGPTLRRHTYLIGMGEREVAELDEAVWRARREGRSAADVRVPEDFPLRSLAITLARVKQILENGPGFSLLRKVPVECYSPEECELALMGLMVHLGVPVHQDTRGTLVEHVFDRLGDRGAGEGPAYLTSTALPPHCDAGDVSGFLCVRRAPHGGVTTICSALTIYRELLVTEPELLEPLCRGFRLRARESGPWFGTGVTRRRVPVFNWKPDRLEVRFDRDSVRMAEALPGVPALDPIERVALDRVVEIALSREVSLALRLQPGDVQLVNNHVVLHARSAYEDPPEPDRKRLLLRVCVNTGGHERRRRRPADRLGPGWASTSERS